MSDTSSQPVWVSVAEAARALGISETAVRKRIRVRSLGARGERGATQVQIPIEDGSQLSSQLTKPNMPTDQTLEVARLTGELVELRARLADTQEDRDRWHANATAVLERYNHDMQEMRTLLGREQAVAISAQGMSATPDLADVASENAPQDVNSAPLRGDTLDMAQPAQREASAAPGLASDRLALGWRRWWRRMIGG